MYRGLIFLWAFINFKGWSDTVFKKEWDKIHSHLLSGVLYGERFHLYCSKGIIFIMHWVFLAAKSYCKLSGYDLTFLEVEVICYERMVSDDLHNKDRKGNLTKSKKPIGWWLSPCELSLQWRMRGQEKFQNVYQINISVHIKKKPRKPNTEIT